MATAADFHPLILPTVPGAPIPAVNLHIRTAIRIWCERTWCWRDRQAATIPAQAAYQLYHPQHAVIHRIEGAWFDGQELDPVPYNRLSPEELDETGVPKRITQATPDTVIVVPRADGELILNAILKPQIDDTAFDEAIPDFFFDDFGMQIAHGALSTLLALPRMPWANGDIAIAHRALFEQAMSDRSGFNFNGKHRPRRRAESQFL